MLTFLHANYPSHTRKSDHQEERTKTKKMGETPDLRTAAERVGRLINMYLAHEGHQTPNGGYNLTVGLVVQAIVSRIQENLFSY